MIARLSVPANLLICGEYAVTEPLGVGLAAAVEPRLTLTIEPAERLTITAELPGGLHVWSPTFEQSPDGSWQPHAPHDPHLRLAAAVVATVFGTAGGRSGEDGAGPPRTPAVNLHVDSRSFFGPGGRKRGFGSSAAVAVALCAALVGLQGYPGFGASTGAFTNASTNPIPPTGGDRPAIVSPPTGVAARLQAAVFGPALQAHRAAQGGRGSGYDVAASTFGGLGVFTGGRLPVWEPWAADWLPPAVLFPGPAAVDTAGAIAAYQAFVAQDAGRAAHLRDAMTAAVRGFCTADSWSDARRSLSVVTEAAVRLGDVIGVPARIEPAGELAERYRRSPAWFIKAVGAGNELGLALCDHQAIEDCRRGRFGDPAVTAAPIAAEGVRWES